MTDIDVSIRPFVLPKTEYTRDGDPVKQWVKSQTRLISKLYGYDEAYVERWVKDSIRPNGVSPFYDRQVAYIHQTSPGNRELKKGSFYQYQKICREEGFVLSPSQTAYKDPVKNPALTAKFTDRNAKLRSFYKKRGQDFKVKGEKKKAAKDNQTQAKKKEINNSFSGANSSWFNALCNASGHQALTSTCRSATSYANITAERFLAGNRMYVHKDVVFQELNNACLLANHDVIMGVVNTYGLVIPTYQDVFNCARRSFVKYFKSDKIENEIRLFISTMDEASRCAFVYLGDLYHLDILNPTFVENLFYETYKFAEMDVRPSPEYFLEASDDIKALVFSILKEMTKGKLYIDKNGDKGLNQEEKNIVNNTIKAFFLFLNKYKDLVSGLWRMNYLPSGMAYLRTMLREAILTSDTDSAIMTMQYWTKRITGSYNFDNESYLVSFNLIYFVSESIANSFGKMCANMGVPPELIDQLGAKNEYAFPVYCLSESMKHYFAEKALEEGRVLPTPELELKGVGYISARHNQKIAEEHEEYIVKDIIGMVKEKVTLNLNDVLERPIRLEKETRETIRSGGTVYQTSDVKPAEQYKTLHNNATYKQYLLWNEVFGPVYGKVDEPPYSTYKVPVMLSKKRHIVDWINSIEDRSTAARLEDYFNRHKTEAMSSILVPMQIVDVKGVPREIVQVVDEKRAVSQIMGPFYLALGGLGLFHTNMKNSKLMTDSLFVGNLQPKQSSPLLPSLRRSE